MSAHPPPPHTHVHHTFLLLTGSTLSVSRCREAEDEAQGLREEKESLMKTLRYLQEEFLRLDRAQNRRTDAK